MGRQEQLELLIASAAPDDDPAVRAAIASLAPVPWGELDTLTAFHRMWPLLAERITRLGLAPPGVAAGMTSRFRLIAGSNLLLTATLAELVAAFRAEHIPVMPHKGPVLALSAYGDPVLREFGDLDLLVHCADLARAMALLERLGYARPARLAWLPAEALCRWGSEMIFTSARGIAVDLHWRMAPPHYPVRLKSSIVWRAQGTVRLAGADVPVPAAEPNLLLLATHGARHAWECLGWLADLAWLARAPGAPDWRNALDLAGTTRCQRPLLLAASLLGRVFHIGLPRPILARVPPDIATLAGRVVERWRTGPLASPGSRELLEFARVLEPSIVRLIRHLAGLAFSPTEAEWSRMRLPAALYPLYAPYRAGRLLFRGLGGQAEPDHVGGRHAGLGE